MLILGIETSCDETAAALVEDGEMVLSNIIASQADTFGKFGGVIPEVAARKHLELICPVVELAISAGNKTLQQIDGIAVTSKHGLAGSLLVGVNTAKALAYSLGVPLIGVHHVEGHIFANMLSNPDMQVPHICLTVSGGHTMLILVHDLCKYELLGNTLDDAAGEAFDKVAKYIGLGFPGGPLIDKVSTSGNCRAFTFPRPLMTTGQLDFSFSGLKTAVVNLVKKQVASKEALPVPDIAASFQEAVVEVLVSKTFRAAQERQVPTISVTGGVAANRRLRKAFAELAIARGVKVYFPRPDLCTDNAAMVAAAGCARLDRGYASGLDLDIEPGARIGIMDDN